MNEEEIFIKDEEIFKQPEYKSKMMVGNITIMQEKHFNWFYKIMWRLLLGIKIVDME